MEANFSIDDARPLKVVVIGAGYSGIVAGIRYLQKVKNVNLTIYDAQNGIGGTWFINKYPGLACDIPSHCYQLSFAENPNWSAFYASGPEILAYLDNVVDTYKLAPYIKLRHRMMSGRYSERDGKWILTIRRPVVDSGTEGVEWEEFEDTCDILFTGTGLLNRWTWPDIPGLHDFHGPLIHTAAWETGSKDPNVTWQESVKDWGDKSVGVIGVGSSAIQVVPSLQPRVKHLTNFVRGKTWVSVNFVRQQVVRLTGDENNADNYVYTDEDKAKFQDPKYYRQYRKEVESDLNASHGSTLRGNPMQEMGQVMFKEMMQQRLAKKPWIAEHLIPDFGVACRRLTPGPGYLEALCEDNVDFVGSNIARVTPNGVQTVDGKHHELDVLICATGFDIIGHLPFELTGRNGVTLSSKYSPHPRTYMSVAVDGFPNWFQSLGPNSMVGTGSLLLVIERQVDYAIAASLKMQREHIKSMEVRKEAVDDFDEYLENYFPRTVFSEHCRSWYKAGKADGRVVALWPGSCTHAALTLANPRWEDYVYERLPKAKNRFHWLGDGTTMSDTTPGMDKAWYLDESQIDVPPIPV